MSSIASARKGAQQSPWGYGYGYNLANQRRDVILNDGSTWQYEYDRLEQVVSANRKWSDGALVGGQQFEYDFDELASQVVTDRIEYSHLESIQMQPP